MTDIRDQKTIDLNEQRKLFRKKLLYQFLLVGWCSAAFQFLINIFEDSKVSIYTELDFILLISILIVVNKKGNFKISRSSTLIVINLALFFSYRIEPTAGIQYYYFPMVLLSFVLHDQKELLNPDYALA